MTKKEVQAKLDAIVSFAGVEKFLDTPVKHYSSGMFLRLGFAVAAHLEPDVLVVDEVLAVGDAGFQKKCLNAMDDLRSGGRTVLFVSHNMAAVENLCSRVIWIENGEIRQDGCPKDVIQAYTASFSEAQKTGYDLEKVSNRRGNGAIRYTRIELINDKSQPITFFGSGDRVTFRLYYEAKERISSPDFEVAIYTALGTLITRFSTWSVEFDILSLDAGTGYIELRIDSLTLMTGRYYVSLGLKTQGPIFYDVLEYCAQFEVEGSSFYGSGKVFHPYFGLTLFPCKWTLNGTFGDGQLCPSGSEYKNSSYLHE
jgi:lipopolysaccharide transport system ATP-binding protein